VHQSNELCQAHTDAMRETRACETSERENCCVPHYDESHEGGKSSPDLCAQSCPTPDQHGYNEGVVAKASEQSEVSKASDASEASKTNKATCIIDSNMHTWTNVLHLVQVYMMTSSLLHNNDDIIVIAQ